MTLKETAFEFAKRAAGIDKISSIILFGSVARGEEDSRSDVDMFVVFDSNKSLGRIKETAEVSRIALDLEKEYNKSIQLVMTNKKFEKLDPYFLAKVFKEGIILYGKNSQIGANKLKLCPYSIINFSLGNLQPSEKMKVKRALYGYNTTKIHKGKKYQSSSEGLVKEIGAQRIGKASILLPCNKAKKLIKTLDLFKIKYKKTDVWLQEI